MGEKGDFGTDVFPWTLRNVSEQCFRRTHPGEYFCIQGLTISPCLADTTNNVTATGFEPATT